MDPQTEQPEKPRTFGRYIPIVLIAVGFIAVLVFGGQDYLTIDSLRENKALLLDLVAEWGAVAVGAFVLLYAAMILLVPPSGTIMTLSSGLLFGTLWGGIATVMGATLGASLLFLATRTAFGDVLRKRAGPALQKMEAGFQDNAVSYMLFLRLVPVFPFFVVNIVPAFLGVPLRIFAVTTAIGIIPGTFVYASLGAGLGAIFDEQSLNLGLVFEPQYLLPILGLAALALLPIILKRRRGMAG